MKYSSNNKPLVCMQTNSTCYKGTRKMTIKGVLWHSTGANNTLLRRYVQPSDNASDRDKWLKLLGKNNNGNDWNHVDVKAGLNAWIGKLADGTVATVQTMPWNYRPWGCGSGSKGSCNDTHLQFEICEDALTDKAYFDKVYKEACELTAYICKMYNLDPYGTVSYNGVKVPVILCHQDSYKLGLGSNHGDVLHWFKKHGKTMDDVRRDVSNLLNGTGWSSVVEKTHIDTLAEKGVINSPDYWRTTQYKLKYLDVLLKNIAEKASNKTLLKIDSVSDAIAHLVDNGIISSPDYWQKNYSKVKYLDILLISAATHFPSKFASYKVKVNANKLNIRKGAGTNYEIIGTIEDQGVYTIVEEANGKGADKWGLLKSYQKNRNGWISLDFCKRI